MLLIKWTALLTMVLGLSIPKSTEQTLQKRSPQFNIQGLIQRAVERGVQRQVSQVTNQLTGGILGGGGGQGAGGQGAGGQGGSGGIIQQIIQALTGGNDSGDANEGSRDNGRGGGGRGVRRDKLTAGASEDPVLDEEPDASVVMPAATPNTSVQKTPQQQQPIASDQAPAPQVPVSQPATILQQAPAPQAPTTQQVPIQQAPAIPQPPTQQVPSNQQVQVPASSQISPAQEQSTTPKAETPKTSNEELFSKLLESLGGTQGVAKLVENIIAKSTTNQKQGSTSVQTEEKPLSVGGPPFGAQKSGMAVKEESFLGKPEDSVAMLNVEANTRAKVPVVPPQTEIDPSDPLAKYL